MTESNIEARNEAIVLAATRETLQPETRKTAPNQCCADFAAVKFCDNDVDAWECWVCGETWEAPCR